MKTLIEFKEFVDKINLNNSRIYKLTVLEEYKDNDTIKTYLKYIYDPYIIFGISDKKLNKDVIINSKEDFDSFFDLLSYIRINNTGTDKVIQAIRSFFLTKLTSDLIPLASSIITKNLQLGVDTKSINKIIPNLIPEFSVMLANKYFDDPSKVEGKEFALTRKIDGNRIIAIKEDGAVSFFTRQGQQYEGLVDLAEELKSKFPDNICFDGELTLLDPGDLTSGDQYKATTKLCRTKDQEKHGLKMLVFDYMPAYCFRNQKCEIPYNKRREYLSSIFQNNDVKFFNLLPILYQGDDTAKIVDTLHEQVSQGEEGVMINILNAPYEFKRTSNLLKCKLFNTLDLEVVDYFEGENSNQNKLGGFIVRYKDGNLVRVGSGYSKEFREEAWKDPKSYIGRIIEVSYFEETTNANGGLSLRFPVFCDLRDPADKNTADF